MRTSRRIATILVALAVALGIAFAGTPSAAADPVTVSYQCSSPAGGLWDYNWRITIVAPATASPGQTVTLEVTTELVGSPLAEPLAAGLLFGGLEIHLGGASSGTTPYTNGLTNPDLEVGELIRMTGGIVQVTLANIGDVTYTPARFIFGALGWGVWCGVRTGTTAPVAATTRVTAL